MIKCTFQTAQGPCTRRAALRVDFIESWFPMCRIHAATLILQPEEQVERVSVLSPAEASPGICGAVNEQLAERNVCREVAGHDGMHAAHDSTGRPEYLWSAMLRDPIPARPAHRAATHDDEGMGR